MKKPKQFPEVIDSSLRSDWNQCQVKGYWHYFRKKISTTESEHLVAGGAYAHALEVYRKSYYGDGLSAKEAAAEGLLALTKSYGAFETEDNSKPWARMAAAYESYLANYPPATDYIVPHMISGAPCVEFSFALPIDEVLNPDTDDPIIYAGKFDMLADYNNMLFVLDDKTTKQLGATWPARWDLRSQLIGYCWGARQFGHDVQGAIVRGTGILKTKITHAEAICYYPQHIIADWYNRLIHDLQKMVVAYTSNRYYHDGMESDACSAYGGCPYKTLCSARQPEDWLAGNYSDSTWSPVAKADIEGSAHG